MFETGSIAAVCLSAKSKSRDALIRRNKLQMAILKLISQSAEKNTTIEISKTFVHDTHSIVCTFHKLKIFSSTNYAVISFSIQITL